MASKQPLTHYRGRIEIEWETKATSESAARRKAMSAITSIYKEIRVHEKECIYVDEGWYP